MHILGLVRQTRQMSGLWMQAKTAGWVLPHQRICWVSERHHVLERDNRGRLHSVSGPAVMYPDGWSIYAVHGVRVPGDIIEKPESITPERITAEGNAEIRRVMMEIYGLDRYLHDIGARPVHADEYGELFRIDGMQFPLVRVINSTPEPDGSRNVYVLTAAREDCRTAHDAVASTFGLTADTYRPSVQT